MVTDGKIPSGKWFCHIMVTPTINLFCPGLAGAPITQPRPGGRSSIVALWHWEGARNLLQAPQLVFFSASCGEIQIILLATGHAVWISDLTTVNQEVIGSVGQPPIHDFPWNCCLSSATPGFLAPCFSSALSSGKYKSLALLCAVAVTCNSVCCIFSRLVPSILERCAAWMQKIFAIQS